ncbi:transportin-3 [Lasius niger]|uniref:Transportin-3 n=1 Tax=Lasius niger TaxID=67767 RepID=A0A0J7KSX5_LASNI|nr:transportin-3 [Lasius niger]
MDSPPNLDTVYQAVCSLYNNTNPAEPGKASLWLGELQKSLCLALADLVLQMQSWQKPIVDLINRFGTSTANLWPLLEILTVLPEEASSRSLSWITVHAIPLEAIPSSDVIAYALQVLSNHMAGSQLHETATDCICVILQTLGEDTNRINNSASAIAQAQLQQVQLCIFTSVMNLEQPYHLSVAHEDMEKSINYCRIFTELAETFLELMVAGSEATEGGEQFYATQILDLVLTCVGHHDYELGLVEEGGGGEEFADFRNRVSDLIKDVVFVVGSSHCFRQMFSSLTGGPGPQGQAVHTPTWDSTEAALFVMQAVAKNILPEENDVVPKVVEAILHLPENTHIAVRYTSILLLGELCEWIDRHPQSLEPVLNFLLACLNQKGLGTAASGALLSICTACPLHMSSHFSGLLQIARSLDNFPISNDAAIGLLKGVSIILARLPHEEITTAMRELCCFQASSLWALLTDSIPIERGTKTDPVIWLDRLAAIFKHTNPQIPNPIDEPNIDEPNIDEPNIDESNKPHPCQSVVVEMWPVLSNVCEKYQRDVRVMERCCRCIRFAVRCVGKYSAHLLEPIVKQIVPLYTVHQHSCFLYLGSILVDEYATDSECVWNLVNMLQAFIGPTFALLEQEDGLKNHPDTVDDLFRLCASLDHRDANSSVMKFFYDLLHSGRSYKDRSDYTIRRQLVQNIMQEKGQTLVIKLLHASVFELSSYMLSDVADVIIELTRNDTDLMSKWLREAILTMPLQNAGGAPTATCEQFTEFHNTVTRSETPKTVTHALRNFARLYR